MTTEQQDPENWQARLSAVISKLDEAISTGAPEPARRAMEIANQLLAEAVILDAKSRKDDPDSDNARQA
jgi:hypothetical protein